MERFRVREGRVDPPQSRSGACAPWPSSLSSSSPIAGVGHTINDGAGILYGLAPYTLGVVTTGLPAQGCQYHLGSAGSGMLWLLGLEPCADDFRGRGASYRAPPAQLRTGPFRGYGSHLGCLTAKRLSGHG